MSQDWAERREKLESWRTTLEEWSDSSEEGYGGGAGCEAAEKASGVEPEEEGSLTPGT